MSIVASCKVYRNIKSGDIAVLSSNMRAGQPLVTGLPLGSLTAGNVSASTIGNLVAVALADARDAYTNGNFPAAITDLGDARLSYGISRHWADHLTCSVWADESGTVEVFGVNRDSSAPGMGTWVMPASLSRIDPTEEELGAAVLDALDRSI
jgi:hypothetical protein